MHYILLFNMRRESGRTTKYTVTELRMTLYKDKH